jgi:predicted outer membrane repeat protein
VALLATLIPAVEMRLAPPRAAFAANFLVNLAADPGDGTCDDTCTLRDAIDDAGALAGHDTITFSPAVTAPIVLASALPPIAEALTIDGSGQAIIVDGASSFRVFRASAPLTLTALTIQRGRAPNDGFGGGGGASFGSSGTLSAVNFISNTSLAVAFGGGGAYFAASATVVGGSFISNTATAGSGGGAHFAGAAVVSGTAFLSNTTSFNGGGLFAATTATITNTSLISNTAAGDGGGAYVFGAASVSGSSFTRNRAASVYNSSGGGASFLSAASVVNTTFMNNTAVLDGGGAKFWNAAAAIRDSAFTGNSAQYGGGALLAAGGGLTNTTFTSNTALGDGGGLYMAGGSAAGARPEGGDIAPITGATFTGNSATMGAGGGAYLGGPSAINGSQFNGNTAATSGGGVYASGAGQTIPVMDSLFATNSAGSGGGGGARFSGPAAVTGSTFSGNSALGNGGGLRLDTFSWLTTTSFVSNAVTGVSAHGGGAYFGGAVVLTSATFLSNTAQNGNGGGLFGAGTTMTNTTVTGNQALCEDERALRAGGLVAGPPADCGDGGGGWFSGAVNWVLSLFSSNHADRKGGGSALSCGVPVIECKLDTSQFFENTAGDLGGGLYLGSGEPLAARVILESNRAGSDGGGAYLANSRSAFINPVFNNNTLLNSTTGASDIGMAFHNSTLNVTHGTFAALASGNRLSISAGTDQPDDLGVQIRVVNITNSIFHNYGIAVQGQAPTSTVTISGVLFSNVITRTANGDFNTQVAFTGLAGFVNEVAGDFHLTAASDAIDRGVITAVTIDFDGNPRNQGLAPDLGAYEHYRNPITGKLYLPLVSKGP